MLGGRGRERRELIDLKEEREREGKGRDPLLPFFVCRPPNSVLTCRLISCRGDGVRRPTQEEDRERGEVGER